MNPSELLETYLQDGQEALASFASALARLRAGDASALQDLAVLAHRMKGTGALYGHPQTARLAALAERLLESRPQLPPQGRALLVDVLERTEVCLRSALDNLARGRGEGELGLAFAQMGGPQALRELLRLHPEAFRPVHSVTGAVHGAPDASPGAALPAFKLANEDVWEYFAPEVREHLEALRAGLDDGGTEALSVMFRAAHTIKGSSYMVGLPLLGDLAHGLEDLMTAVRDGQLPLAGRAQGLLQEGAALCERVLAAAEGAPGDLDAPLAALRARVAALLAGDPEPETAPAPEAPAPTAPVAPARQTVRVGVDTLDAVMDLVGELVSARARLEGVTMRLEALEASLAASHERVQRQVRDFEERYLNPDMARADTPELPDEASGGLRRSVGELFADLELDSYNDLNILARAVTELSADLGELRGQYAGGLEDLRGEQESLGKLLRRLRASVSRTRHVPFEQALTRVRRWARGRPELNLSVQGEGVQVDAFVAEALAEALLHLATNALVHGLDSAESRAALAKPAALTLDVRARARGRFLEVEVSDDGRGLNLSAVRAQALARGLRSARELQDMTDEDAARLIFLPGLSTAAAVTGEAGRGVGMDVVAARLRRLGGEVRVVSTPRLGTRFTLRVPLDQQVGEVLVTRVGPHPLGFMGAAVRRLLELSPHDLTRDGGVERLPDGTPLVRLQELWGTPVDLHAPVRVVLADSASGPLAFAVDRLERLQEGVIQQPDGLLGSLGYLAGTSVDATGAVLPLLDPAGTARLAGRTAAAPHAQPGATPTARGARVLLTDDSISVRRAVARMLERGGWQVETAQDGQAALDLLQRDPHFDLLLTDLEMPRVNGFELIEELRRREGTRDLPIVVMTTRAGEKHQQLAFALGASDYFSKPVDETSLLRRLSGLAGRVPIG